MVLGVPDALIADLFCRLRERHARHEASLAVSPRATGARSRIDNRARIGVILPLSSVICWRGQGPRIPV